MEMTRGRTGMDMECCLFVHGVVYIKCPKDVLSLSVFFSVRNSPNGCLSVYSCRLRCRSEQCSAEEVLRSR